MPFADREAPAPISKRPETTKPDRLGGEVLPRTSARRSNLAAIGTKVSQNRKSTLQPFEPKQTTTTTTTRVRPKLIPTKQEQSSSVRARPNLVPYEPTAKTTNKRPMPGLLENDADEEEDIRFANVRQSLRWLESYLDTNGHQLADELVFFAPTSGSSQRILDRAELRGKTPAVKPIVEFHLCEHSGTVDGCELVTVSGHKIKIGLRGKILQPKVKSAWTDFVGTKDVSGFTVHIYAHANTFKH
jgi:hypothetical protein